MSAVTVSAVSNGVEPPPHQYLPFDCSNIDRTFLTERFHRLSASIFTELIFFKTSTFPSRTFHRCGHTFCATCLHISFSNHRFCPLCRALLSSIPAPNQVHTLLRSIIEKKYPLEYRRRGTGGFVDWPQASDQPQQNTREYSMVMSMTTSVTTVSDFDNVSSITFLPRPVKACPIWNVLFGVSRDFCLIYHRISKTMSSKVFR